MIETSSIDASHKVTGDAARMPRRKIKRGGPL